MKPLMGNNNRQDKALTSPNTERNVRKKSLYLNPNDTVGHGLESLNLHHGTM